MWASKEEQLAALQADIKVAESVSEQRAVAFMRLRLDETYGKVKGGGTDG